MLAAQPALMALSGVSGALAPALSRAGPDAAAALARRMGRAGALCAAAAGLTAAAAAWGAGGLGLSPSAGLAAGPLVALTLGAALLGLEAPIGLRLIAEGRARAETALQLAGAAAATAAAAAWAPIWGAAGLAAAVAAGAAARLLLSRVPRFRPGAAKPDARLREVERDPRLAPPPDGWRETWAAIRADHARLDHVARAFAADLLAHKTFRAIAAHRLERWARLSRGPARALIVPTALWRRHVCTRLGAELPWQARIGPGLRLLHGFGIVVLPCARVGAGATLAHGATLGYRARPEAPTTPISAAEVEDGAFVGPYAVVWARLGAGSVLAPHALLRDPVGPGMAVGGAPARPLRPLRGRAEETGLAAG